MLNSSTQIRKIDVSIWDHVKQAYQPVGSLVENKGADRVVFAYLPDYSGPSINPNNLNYNTHGRIFTSDSEKRLPETFKNFLPGAFANQLLKKHHAPWACMTDFDKLYYLGTRDIGGLRFESDISYPPTRPTNQHQLDLLGKQIAAFSMGELDSLISDENLYALSSHGGARPKVAYQHKDLTLWVAKYNKAVDPYSISKVEHALNLLAYDAGINVTNTAVLPLPSGGDVFLSRRFDLQSPHLEENTKEVIYQQKYHKLSFASILGFDTKGYFTDLVQAIHQYSVRAVEDTEELYKRMLLHVSVNNTDNHLKNFEMMLKEDGWCLAPSYDVLPDESLSIPFSTGINQKYSCAEHCKLTPIFIQNTAHSFGIRYDRAIELAKPVLLAVCNITHYLERVKLSEQEQITIRTIVKHQEAQHCLDDF